MPEHLRTRIGAYGEHALLVGDPARAELIATELLEGAELVTDARGLNGYAGRFNLPNSGKCSPDDARDVQTEIESM